MKKALSLIISSAIGMSVLCAPADVSAESTGGLVLLGDSISTGYGLDAATEYNYGQICADYLGCESENYAVDGADSEDLYNLITTDSTVRSSISGAETVVISIGGNDIMQYVAKEFIEFAANKGYLKDGYTADSIPEKPSVDDLYTMVRLTDENGTYTGDCLLRYMVNNKMEALTLITNISGNLRVSNATYEGYIPNVIIPNIEKIKDEITSLNNDAQIIFQTVYQPLQFTEEYYNERFGTGGEYASIKTAFDLLRTNLVDIMSVMRDKLFLVEDISVADVYYEFTALEDISTSKANASQGSAHYFTNIQTSGTERDIHPNQNGHLAIAAAVLNQINFINYDAQLLTQIYNNLEDKESYPAIPLETYHFAATAALGDINSDTQINPVDATLALQQYSVASMNGEDILDAHHKAAANVDKTDVIDPIDATWILRYYSLASMGYDGTLSSFISSN